VKFLPTKGQGHAMPFVLLVLLFFSQTLFASPDCPIISARFPLADGSTADNSATGWYLDASKVAGYFAVKSNRLHAQELGGEGIWYSKVFSAAGYTGWQVAVKISSEGDMNSSEYVKIYYKINGGNEVLLDQRTGNFGTIDFISPLLNGNNVQLVVKIYNYNNGGSQTSKYYIEEYRLFKEKGPCSSAITVTATAGNGGVITCANPSLSLSAGSSASGVSYSWTGPNGFTSTQQNPVVSAPGTYTVVGTSASGSGSAAVTVIENKAAPDLSATGGNLACGTSVTLNASSSVAGVTYSWTGPNGFTSSQQNPVVSTAGSYTVTVRNPANGCTNSQTVQVTSGTAAATNLWVEDFTLSNGTTTDNGATAWTSSKPSGSTFAVTSNEYRVSGIGTGSNGVWTSGSIPISGKTNVSISVGTRSSGVAMNTDGTYADYIRFYYKLNGGSEVMFAEKKGNINNHSTTNSTVSVAGLSGSTVQIVIRARATGTDEFYYFDNVTVAAVNPAVTLATSVSGPVTCTGSAQITVTPSSTVSSWAWTGPNGFTSTAQNPSVAAGGQYTVTATLPGGCTISAPVTVAENKSIPDVTATGGALGCLSGVTVNASSAVSNAQYSWTGPNGFTSTVKSPVVSAAGTYTVTVKDPANGCTNTASAQVTTGTSAPSAFWLEDFTLANGTTSDNGNTSWTLENSGAGTISVQNNEFKVSYDAAAEARWHSGIIDISGKSNVVISVNLRSETASSSDHFESDDYIRVYYKLNGGAEVLVYDDAAGIGNTTNSAASTIVSSAALSGSTLQVIIKARNSDKTERYFFDNVKLTGSAGQSSITAAASVQDSLTCVRTTVTLSGSSNITGATYSWTGPDSFTSTAQNPAATGPGNYILTVTDPATGCTAKDTATVKQNITAPGASAGVSGSLSCAASQVTLQGSSATAGVSYRWTGPNGFTSTAQNPQVSSPGTYTLTVTDPVTGCTSTQAVSVISHTGSTTDLWVEDFTLSNGTTVDNGATAWSTTTPSGSTFAVNNNEFKISGQGTTGESVWTSAPINITGKTGVGIAAIVRSAITGSAVMNETGVYADYIQFYYKLNGGSEVLFAEKRSAINNHSTTYTNISVGGLSGTSLQIVIRARATGTDEFYYVDNVKVTGAGGNVDATAAVSGPLSCKATSVTLLGNSATAAVTYNWTGPDNFTSTQQNPVVTVPGNYTLAVTAPGGCTASAQVTVVQNIAKPGLSVTQPRVLNCSTTAVELSAATTTTGAIITWTGFAEGRNPVNVNLPGKYYVTAKDTANGCTKLDSVTVIQDTVKPNLTVTQPGVLNCTITSANLTATTATIGATITWTGFTAGQNPVSVSVPGKYYVTVKGANGCIRMDSVTVTQNIAKPDLSIPQPGVLNCTTTTVSLNASSAGSTITWTGFATGLNPVTVSAPGKYYVTATAANGCTKKDSVIVMQDITKPTLTATAPAVLTCTTTSVSLLATSNGTITWTGFAAGQNPVSVTAPGKYYVTATAANGCTQKDSVTVTQDITQPTLAVTAPAVLTCATTSVNLSATSNGTITWTGFTSGQNPVSVTAPGKYYVTATAANGCTQKDSVIVTQDITKPTLTVSVPAVLTCATTTVNLSATSNGTITWTGFASGQNPVSVSAPGKYYVTATAANGCTQKDSVIVTQDITKPTLTVSVPAVLTCATTSVNLSATSNGTITWTGFAAGQNPVSVSAPGKYYVTATAANGCTQKDSVTVTQDITQPTLAVTAPAVLTCATTSVNLSATSNGTITWTGFTSGQNPVSVSAPGKYYVTATAANGCTQKDSVTVMQDGSKPTLTVIPPAVLTCSATSVSLTATSNGTIVTWTGFAAGQNPVSVSAPGKYYVTATAANGCTQKDSVTVMQDITKPTLAVTAPAVLTCTTTSVNLLATSNGTITWTGFAAGQNPVSVTAPGKYYVTATAANGCTQKDSVTVTQDITQPTLAVTAPAVLTCATTSVNLSATSNGTITWTGFTSGQNPVSVTAPGKYYVTATAANGCTQKDSVIVTQDITKPTLTVSVPAVLTCATTTVNLSATSNGTITWTGFASGQNPVSVSAPGKYYVTATAANGCTQKDSVIVTQDITKPTLTVSVPAVLTCATTSVNLSATSNGTITWTGFAAGQNPVSVSAPGKYYVTATAANGCTQKDSVTVTQDITQPTLAVTAPAVLTCATTSVNLSATSNGTITWTGFTSGQNPVSVSAPGKYYVTATAANGCTQKDSVTVTQDGSKPTLTVTPPAVLTCSATSVSLTATSNGTIVTWTGFAAGQNPVSVTAPGKYYVTATAANGCTQKDSVIVTQDITKPTLAVTAPAVLTCATTSVNLSATSNGTITWTGFAAGQNPVSVTAPGKYYVTATAANGCTQKDSVTVMQDVTKPTLAVTAPAVLTCATTSVNLSATSNGTITWTGFAAGQNPVSVSAPGKYYVTATAANGCTQKDSVTVMQDITKPTLAVTAPAVLTCATTSVNLSATSNGTITWTGFTSGQNPVSVSAPGKYYVTATAANGCTQKDSVIVTQDITKPTLTVSVPAVLTCATTSVNLSATSNGTITWTGFTSGQNPVSVSASVTQPPVLTCLTTSVNLSAVAPGATITWTGFAAGQNPVSTNVPRKYYVTATSANGCIQKDSVTVAQDITPPANVQATNDGPLTCAKTNVKLTGNSTTPDATYRWTKDGVAIANTAETTVNAPGTYALTVTNPANGCAATSSTPVQQNITPPANVQATNDGPITCTRTVINLTGQSSTTGVSYRWSGPGNFSANTATTTTTVEGTYTLTVTNQNNGCAAVTNTRVVKNVALPAAVINPPASQPAPLSVDLLTAQSVPNATYTWTLSSANTNWQVVDGSNTATFIYQAGNKGTSATFTLVVVDKGNNCRNTAQITLTATELSLAGSSAAKQAAPLEYQAYPNPFTDKMYITFKSPVNGKVNVALYGSRQGILEQVLFNGMAQAGVVYKLAVDGAGLTAGMHYCVISANGKVYTTKLILVR
jgi:hypothetical protein